MNEIIDLRWPGEPAFGHEKFLVQPSIPFGTGFKTHELPQILILKSRFVSCLRGCNKFGIGLNQSGIVQEHYGSVIGDKLRSHVRSPQPIGSDEHPVPTWLYDFC